MNAVSTRRIAPVSAASLGWFALTETALRVLLVAAAPICAVIFVAKTF